jgi:hypothetical protein
MSYDRARLIVEGLVEAGMINSSAKYEVMQLLNLHGTKMALDQIEIAQSYLKAITNHKREI